MRNERLYKVNTCATFDTNDVTHNFFKVCMPPVVLYNLFIVFKNLIFLLFKIDVPGHGIIVMNIGIDNHAPQNNIQRNLRQKKTVFTI